MKKTLQQQMPPPVRSIAKDNAIARQSSEAMLTRPIGPSIDPSASNSAHPGARQMTDIGSNSARVGLSGVQRKAVSGGAGDIQPVTRSDGLPSHLKIGIEALAGMSMDHVKVHANSSEPTRINAHAYTQGSDIYLAPGQEKHLAHEAWHVVQQAQGRVRPTLQMKSGTQVNDDAHLEAEADAMGARAMALTTANTPARQAAWEAGWRQAMPVVQHKGHAGSVVQCFWARESNMPGARVIWIDGAPSPQGYVDSGAKTFGDTEWEILYVKSGATISSPSVPRIPAPSSKLLSAASSPAMESKITRASVSPPQVPIIPREKIKPAALDDALTVSSSPAISAPGPGPGSVDAKNSRYKEKRPVKPIRVTKMAEEMGISDDQHVGHKIPGAFLTHFWHICQRAKYDPDCSPQLKKKILALEEDISEFVFMDVNLQIEEGNPRRSSDSKSPDEQLAYHGPDSPRAPFLKSVYHILKPAWANKADLELGQIEYVLNQIRAAENKGTSWSHG